MELSKEELSEMEFLQELRKSMTIPMRKRDVKRLEFLTEKYKKDGLSQ